MALLKRIKRTATTPGEAEPVIQARLKKLGMTWQQYVSSLVAYDCWAEKEHLLTGESIRDGRDSEEHLWREIVADFGQPNKTGGFFEHRLEELLARLRQRPDH
jgi:hypothetical protein